MTANPIFMVNRKVLAEKWIRVKKINLSLENK